MIKEDCLIILNVLSKQKEKTWRYQLMSELLFLIYSCVKRKCKVKRKTQPKKKKHLSNHTQRNHEDLQKIKTMKQQIAHFKMIPMKVKHQTNKSCQKNLIAVKAGIFLAINTVLQNFSLQSNSHCIWFIQQRS